MPQNEVTKIFIEKSLKDLEQILLSDEAIKQTAQKFEPAIELVYHAGFEDAVPQKGVKQLDEFARTWILRRSLTLAKLINTTTMDAIRKALSDGFAEGESIAQLAKRIEGYFDGDARARATMAARTETLAASNAGALDRYTKEGIQQKEWMAALDENTRDTHMAANGQIVGIDEDFKVGGDSMPAPGQGSDPSENINCRCTVLPVIK